MYPHRALVTRAWCVPFCSQSRLGSKVIGQQGHRTGEVGTVLMRTVVFNLQSSRINFTKKKRWRNNLRD